MFYVTLGYLKRNFIMACLSRQWSIFNLLKLNSNQSLLKQNHSLASDLEYLQTEYEGLLQKNTELKRKVAHLRNELELVNQSRSVSLDRVQKKSRNSRRLSDPDEIRFYAYERDFDGVFYRQLKNIQVMDLTSSELPDPFEHIADGPSEMVQYDFLVCEYVFLV